MVIYSDIPYYSNKILIILVIRFYNRFILQLYCIFLLTVMAYYKCLCFFLGGDGYLKISVFRLSGRHVARNFFFGKWEEIKIHFNKYAYMIDTLNLLFFFIN